MTYTAVSACRRAAKQILAGQAKPGATGLTFFFPRRNCCEVGRRTADLYRLCQPLPASLWDDFLVFTYERDIDPEGT
jgi:hypothetical protein